MTETEKLEMKAACFHAFGLLMGVTRALGPEATIAVEIAVAQRILKFHSEVGAMDLHPGVQALVAELTKELDQAQNEAAKMMSAKMVQS